MTKDGPYGLEHAFVWTGGKMIDLVTRVIVGTGRIQGQTRAFRVTPR